MIKPLQHVYHCVNLMFYDQGMAPDRNFKLPTNFEDDTTCETIDWERVDKFLATLNDEEIDVFAIGDQNDQVDLTNRDIIEGEYAHNAIETLFIKICI